MSPNLPNPADERRGSGLPVPTPGVSASRAVPALPAALSGGPDARDLLRSFARRWPLAIFGGLAVAVAASSAAFLLVPSPKYAVRAMIHVASTPARIIFQTSESVPDYRSYQRTQATLVKSRKVLNAALRQPEAGGLGSVPTEGDVASWLDKELKVEFPGGAEIMTVTMTGPTPRDLTALVNAVCDAYLKQIVEEERHDRVARYDSLKSLFNKIQDELREKRKTYRVSVEDVGVTDRLSVAARQQSAVQGLGQLQAELSQLQAEIRQVDRKSKMAAARVERAALAEGASGEAYADEAVARSPEIADMRRNGHELKAKLSQVERVSRSPSDPAFRLAWDRYELNERDLRRRVAEVRAEAVRMAVQGARSRDEGERAEIDQTLEILTGQEKALREQVATLGTDLKSGNVKALDMNWLEDEIALVSQTAKTVGAEVEALNVELTARPRIRLIERAETPVLSDPMRRYKLSGAAGMACLGLFVGAVVLTESRARRIGSTDAVARGLGIRLLGSIPARPRGRQLRKDGERWQRVLIESVDAARTLILHAARQEPMKVIMVASATKGEGKTTLSCFLAASLHRAGRRTLLVDGDLRCPTIHRLMDVEPGAGVCEVLRGEADPVEAIRPGVGIGIDFLPAGLVDGDALRGLADGRLDGLLGTLRGHYDQIIVDSAPTLYVPDGLIIAQHVDAVVVSVLRDVSQAPKVHAVAERLADLGVRVLGAIVGGAGGEDSKAYAYQYARGRLGGGKT